MSGKRPIRVVFAHHPPLVMGHCAKFPAIRATDSCRLPGLCVEVLLEPSMHSSMKESQILQLITKEWDLLIEPVVDEADVGAVDTGSYVSLPGPTWSYSDIHNNTSGKLLPHHSKSFAS